MNMVAETKAELRKMMFFLNIKGCKHLCVDSVKSVNLKIRIALQKTFKDFKRLQCIYVAASKRQRGHPCRIHISESDDTTELHYGTFRIVLFF